MERPSAAFAELLTRVLIRIHLVAIARAPRAHAPISWARLLGSLGAAFAHGRGDLETARRCFELALEVLTRNANRDHWALAMRSLAGIYARRTDGDRTENLERAVSYSALALDSVDRADRPFEWAHAQYNLGAFLAHRIAGDRGENVERAVAAYHSALEVYSRENAPEEWTAIQWNLCTIYVQRSYGDLAENIERAIVACGNVLTVLTPEGAPVNWTAAHKHLGYLYRRRLVGDTAANLDLAIGHLQQALRLPDGADAALRASTLAMLGVTHVDQVSGDRAGNLRAAIECLTYAVPRLADAHDRAMALNSLGFAHWCSADFADAAAHLDQAMLCYEAALQDWDPQGFPVEWANAQNSLGGVLMRRERGVRGTNIESALEAFRQSLSHQDRDASPERWAQTATNIGIAYTKRIAGERLENIDQAIVFFEMALETRLATGETEGLRSSFFNVADARYTRPGGDREANFERAIECYEHALSMPEAASAEDRLREARACSNLADALRFARGDSTAHATRAVELLERALRTWTLEAFPHLWIAAQVRLGIAFSFLGAFERGAHCFQGALAAGGPNLERRDELLSLLADVRREIDMRDAGASVPGAMFGSGPSPCPGPDDTGPLDSSTSGPMAMAISEGESASFCGVQ
eukprot:c4623_g1_i1.p1 GENE.c4623_g1_i1~~c4623_g1_i1.p1  ORF type:complete len:705 (+),score=89.61 c4623_g1_i1:190-2115(+)